MDAVRKSSQKNAFRGKTMKTRVRFTGVFLALCAFLLGALPGHSAVLIDTQGSTFYSVAERFGVWMPWQPLSDVVVSNSVTMGGFGVYGAAEETGKIKWVIYENDALLWQSDPQDVVAGGATWYDVSYSTTLVVGNTYTMGVVATNLFKWGQNTASDAALVPIGRNGLQIMDSQPVAQVEEQEIATFLGVPVVDRNGFPFADYPTQTSVRVFDIDGAPLPIPEPAEWSMLIAGLMVIAFVANRRRRMSI
jgi:hypothetical protein